MILSHSACRCRHKMLHSIVAFLLLVSGSVFAQKNTNTVDVAQIEKQFGTKSNLVCLNSTYTYTFEYDTKNPNSKITTKQQVDEEFIAVKKGDVLPVYMSYNEFTDVQDIKAYEKKNNKDNKEDVTILDLAEEEKGGPFFYDGVRMKTFDLLFDPGDEKGYKAERYFSDTKYIGPESFVSGNPTLEKDIIVSVPKWMNIELKEMNFDGYDIQKTVSTDPKNGNTIYTYTAKNLKAVDYYNEKNVPGWSYMYPHVLILCKSYNDPTGKTVNLLSSVDDMYAWYRKLVNEAGNNNATLKPVVNDIIKGKTTDVDKIKAIYYWVEDNIRYLAIENGIAGNKPDDCQNVLQKKYGDCKGMANLLVEMLKICDIDARRVWLGTKQISYDYSIPSLCVNNHCICAVVLNNKYYFLDGTEKYAPFNDNADWIQGKQVMIENGDKYVLQTIPVAPIDRSKIIINKTFTLAPNDMIIGDEHSIYNGESRGILLYEYHQEPSDKKQEALNAVIIGNDPNRSASNIVSSDLKNREIPVKLSYNFKMKNQVSDFDNDVYVNIDYNKWLEGYVFDSTRSCDYEFPYRYNEVANDTLIVPAGYTVKHVPDNL